MARPRAYDPDEAVKAAMQVFWQKGYVATSMADIYAATGLKPGNLYATFTDKETLFRRAFEAYSTQFRATLPVESRGRQAIQDWLDVQAGLATDDPLRKGCLIVNTLAEREAHAPATRALADARLAEIRGFFLAELNVARAAHDILPQADLEGLADFLTAMVLAIMALGRAGATSDMIRNATETAKQTLAAPEKRPV